LGHCRHPALKSLRYFGSYIARHGTQGASLGAWRIAS
jgi:hypothetical protein